MVATEQGREHALEELANRRESSSKSGKIDNSSLLAGSPMYFYCKSCGINHARLPENYISPPSTLCVECQSLKDCGWLE